MPQFDQSIEYSGGIIDANGMEDEIKTKNKALKQKIIFSIILPLLSFNHNSVSGGFCPDGLLNLAVRISKQRPGGLDFFSGCRAMAAGRQPCRAGGAFFRVSSNNNCCVSSSGGKTPC